MVLDKENRELTAAELDLIGGGKRVEELMDERKELQKKAEADDKGGKGAGGTSNLL